MWVASSYPRQNLLMQSTGNRVSLPVFFSSSKKKKLNLISSVFFYNLLYFCWWESSHKMTTQSLWVICDFSEPVSLGANKEFLYYREFLFPYSPLMIVVISDSDSTITWMRGCFVFLQELVQCCVVCIAINIFCSILIKYKEDGNSASHWLSEVLSQSQHETHEYII